MIGLRIVHKSGQRQPSLKASGDQQPAQSHLKAKGFNGGTGVIKGMFYRKEKKIWMSTHTHIFVVLHLVEQEKSSRNSSVKGVEK